jgi:hypothetical protein
MFCTPGLISGGIGGVASHFIILHARTHFWRYRGRRISFSCFALLDSFSAVPRASGPVFMFCVLGLIFGGVECVGSIFMFCAPRLVFGGTKGVVSRFHVLRYRTHFRRYRGRRVPFSCIARPDSFLAVLRASGPVFIFCAWTHFWQYRGRWIPFSCFALPDSFSAVSSASGPVLMFCAPRLVFGGTEGVGSRLHLFRARLVCVGYRSLVYMFCTPGLVSGGTGGVVSHFIVLRA